MISILLFLIVSFFALVIAYKISKIFNFYDLPDNIKIHKDKIPNIAGFGLLPIGILTIFFYDLNEKINTTLFLFLVVILIGLIDDIKSIKPQVKILFLLIPVIIFSSSVFTVNSLGNYQNLNFKLGYLSFLFTVLCILLLTNSFNYLDGIDGLLSFNLIITFIYFLIIDYENIKFIEPFLCFLIIYILFNLNIFRFFPKQFLGDSGSLSLGFLVSALLIILTQSGKYIHPSIIIWSVAFVVYEFLTINIIRIRLKKNILKRDLNFIFNILHKKFNLKISLIFCNLLHVLLCATGLIMNFYNSYSMSISLFIIFFILYCYLRLRFFKSENDLN